ncbi:cytochrome c3 family protein [Sutterella sp.]|uniref:cytochrome c3 family protein n=1 Tax=Sutterella sp. TaxID=1981025 RepID=UPI0025D9143A|nr:cytochrome c3 family protein [uncultured Sutterella sp.]
MKNIKNILFGAAALALACACALPASAAPTNPAAGTTAERHVAKKFDCAVCHKSGDFAKPVRKDACLACHGSYAKLAERTAKDHPNPHISHYGERDCATCHKGHQKSTLTCNECHKFELKTP